VHANAAISAMHSSVAHSLQSVCPLPQSLNMKHQYSSDWLKRGITVIYVSIGSVPTWDRSVTGLAEQHSNVVPGAEDPRPHAVAHPSRDTRHLRALKHRTAANCERRNSTTRTTAKQSVKTAAKVSRQATIMQAGPFKQEGLTTLTAQDMGSGVGGVSSRDQRSLELGGRSGKGPARCTWQGIL
jgi:hypothetical protein